MKRRILSLLLAVVPAALAEEETHNHEQHISELGIDFTIDESWYEAAYAGDVGFFVRADDDGLAQGIKGYLTMYLTPDRTGLPETSDPQVLEDWLDQNGTRLLSMVVLNPKEADTAALDEKYAGFAKTDLGAVEEEQLLFYRNDALSQENADEANAAVIESVLSSFADPAAVITFTGTAQADTPMGDFSAVDLDGELVTPTVFSEAKLTMVNVWATFCGPCIEEMPDLGAIASEYKDKGFQILGVVSDGTDEDTLETAREIVKQTGAAYRHLIPDGTIALLSSIQYVPTTVFVDAQGNQVGEMVVGSNSKADWISTIESMLAQVQ